MAAHPRSVRAKRLEKARILRHRMALQEHRLTTSAIHIEDVLGTPSRTQGHMSLYRVLCATPSIGTATAREIIMTLGLWPHDHLSQLTADQRRAVINSLPKRVRRKSTD